MTELWERQPWDTLTSFSRFQRYYLQQEPPRSLDEAWRRFQSQKRNRPASQITTRASGSWRRWFEGKTSQGQPIAGAVGWAGRAAAYEEYLAEQRLARYEAERLQRQQELRSLATGAFGKLVQAWQRYDPAKDQLKLTELASAFRVITQELRTAYELQQPQEHRHEIEISWQAEVVDLLRQGVVSAAEVKEVLGDELAAELFVRASQATAAD